MENKKEVTVTKHRWLDMSESYFIEMNGKRVGGEITSEESARDGAKSLAEDVDGIFIDELRETNELWS